LQTGKNLFEGSEPLMGSLGQTTFQALTDAPAEQGISSPRCNQRLSLVLEENRERSISLEGRVSDQYMVEGRAKAIDICSRIDAVRILC
jgi:hypothetical protein